MVGRGRVALFRPFGRLPFHWNEKGGLLEEELGQHLLEERLDKFSDLGYRDAGLLGYYAHLSHVVLRQLYPMLTHEVLDYRHSNLTPTTVFHLVPPLHHETISGSWEAIFPFGMRKSGCPASPSASIMHSRSISISRSHFGHDITIVRRFSLHASRTISIEHP